MNTAEIAELVLGMAELTEMPADSGIIVTGENIKKVFAGIDMATPELLLAQQFQADLVLSHHPQTGGQEVFFHRVMERQIGKMVEAGVPINKAQKALRERVAGIERANHVTNYDRVASAARLMQFPYMNLHIPVDIITENLLQAHLNKALGDKPSATLKDVLDTLQEIPEFEKALTQPSIRVGLESDYAGRILVLMAGGTNGGEQVFKAYFEAGVGTIICMHVPEDVRKSVIEQNIGNVIVAGHMASDSIGMNIVCKELEGKGLEVVRMGGIVG
jgi:putative NIF3 family GTP cyclohydrolase 1 type 2